MIKLSDKIILVIAIIWYSLTAYFSIGYFHGDEHYQIIEFTGIKEGTHTSSDLAWEFNAQIRPSIQPTLCYLIFKICDLFSIADPYIKAFILRLLTGLFVVFSIYYFAHSCRHLITSKYWKPFLILSFFTWFLPFVNVRFSSETWSGLFLLLSAAILFKENKNQKHFLLVGFLLGLSFLFRFQTIIASFGILLWLVTIKKKTQTIFFFNDLSTLENLDIKLFDHKKLNLVVLRKKDTQNPKAQYIIIKQGLKKVTEGIPKCFVPFLEIYGGFPTEDILILYSE